VKSAVPSLTGAIHARTQELKIMTRFALLAVILLLGGLDRSSWAVEAQSPGVRNCTWCHGTSAQGYMVAPRLAGQRPQYIETQLQGFHQHTRDNPLAKQYMWSAVAALRPDAEHDLASYFSALPPKPANDGHSEVAAMGKKIFIEGIAEANIVSCYACHGPNAEGIRDIPRLAGLSYAYLKRRLQQWNQGYHSTAGSPMPMVASTLGPDEVEALASYLSFAK
jgi:cytochrome c553